MVLLDLKLPKLNGIDVLKQVSQFESQNGSPHIPIVVLTSSDDNSDIHNCYAAGANSFVRKPTDFQQFRNAITQLSDYWLCLNEEPPSVTHH